MKKVLVLLLSVILLFSLMSGLSGCSKDENKDNKGSDAAKEKIRVGMECDYAPFNWTQPDAKNGAVAISNDSTGYAGGYDVQMAKKIADSLGMELEIVKTDWDGLIPGLTSGILDLVIAGMSPTDDRKEIIDFSDYYYESDLVIVIKKDGPYANAASIADFAGAKITAQQSTTHYDVIEQIEGVNIMEALPDFSSMTNSLKSGFIDGYVSESPHAKTIVGIHSDLAYIAFDKDKGFDYDVNESNISVGMAKGSDLLSKVNNALSKISKDEREQLMIQAMDDSAED